MNKNLNFKPVTPGESLKEVLSFKKTTPGRLSLVTGINRKTIEEIINGKIIISEKIAKKLFKGTGIPANIWLNLESNYQELLKRK
ncbi:MAG: hypothetical protein GY760_02205 [Deltaproteobacteria bacterium]|nr:hypothetical protein [Deltaproteobacteria bacterium]